MTSERYQNKNRKNQELDRSILKTSVQLFVVEKCLSNSFRAAAKRCHKMLGTKDTISKASGAVSVASENATNAQNSATSAAILNAIAILWSNKV